MAQADTNVGPIIFTDESARNHLLNIGKVYTFRAEERTTGKTWARATRTGPKIADVRVEHVAEIGSPSPTALDVGWAHYSGHRTPEDWWKAIERVHGNVRNGHVYRVTLRDTDAA